MAQENQLKALERKKEEQEAHGEIETEHPEYQLYWDLEDIDHSRTKARHLQTNGICERLHRTIQQELYQTVFRKTIFSSLEQLQSDLDAWIASYNTERPHSGKMCCSRTPIQPFFDSLDMSKNKMLDNLHSADIAAVA